MVHVLRLSLSGLWRLGAWSNGVEVSRTEGQGVREPLTWRMSSVYTDVAYL